MTARMNLRLLASHGVALVAQRPGAEHPDPILVLDQQNGPLPVRSVGGV